MLASAEPECPRCSLTKCRVPLGNASYRLLRSGEGVQGFLSGSPFPEMFLNDIR